MSDDGVVMAIEHTNLCRPFFFATAKTPTSQRLSKPSDKTPQAKSFFFSKRT